MSKLITAIAIIIIGVTTLLNITQPAQITPTVSGISENLEVDALYKSCWDGADFNPAFCTKSDKYTVFEDGSFLIK